MGASGVIRVLIAAPTAVLRAGLESVVRADPSFDIIGEEAQPDLILAHIDAGGADPPAGPAILLVADPPPGWVGEALRGGARAVLPQDLTPEEIRAALTAAAEGLVVVHPEILETLLREPRNAPPVESEDLTAREIEVLRMLAEGLPNKTIAWRLGISEHTVKFHVASIMGKLNAASRTEAVAIGMRRGWVPL